MKSAKSKDHWVYIRALNDLDWVFENTGKRCLPPWMSLFPCRACVARNGRQHETSKRLDILRMIGLLDGYAAYENRDSQK